MSGLSVDLHLNLTTGKDGDTGIQERDGRLTVYGRGALDCKLDVRIYYIEEAVKVVKLYRPDARIWVINVSEPYDMC